eukprot:15478589-Alexandrium_andersonii.AAC.1
MQLRDRGQTSDVLDHLLRVALPGVGLSELMRVAHRPPGKSVVSRIQVAVDISFCCFWQEVELREGGP